MWVGLDHDPRGIAASTGSGNHRALQATGPVPNRNALSAKANQPPHTDDETEEAEQLEAQPATIVEVMAWAGSA
jgi:hypothetical protein